MSRKHTAAKIQAKREHELRMSKEKTEQALLSAANSGLEAQTIGLKVLETVIANRRREIVPASEGEAETPKAYTAYGLVVDPHAKLDFTTHGRAECYRVGVKLRAIRLAIAEGHIMPPNDEKYPETFRVYHTGSRLSVCLLRRPPTPGENVVDEVFFDRGYYGDRSVPAHPDEDGNLEECMHCSVGQICHEMAQEFAEEKKALEMTIKERDATIKELQGQLDNEDFGGCDCNNCWYGGNNDNDYCSDDYCYGNGERDRKRQRRFQQEHNDAADANMHELRMAEEETRKEREKVEAARAQAAEAAAKAAEAQSKTDEVLYAAYHKGFESQFVGMKSLVETVKADFESRRPKEVPKTDAVEDNNQHDGDGERDRKRQRR